MLTIYFFKDVSKEDPHQFSVLTVGFCFYNAKTRNNSRFPNYLFAELLNPIEMINNIFP